MWRGLLDSALVIVGRGFRAEHSRFLEVLGECEDRIGVGEVDDAEGVRIGYVGSQRPFGDQPRRANGVIVVSQEADIDAEVGDEVGQHLPGDLDARSPH